MRWWQTNEAQFLEHQALMARAELAGSLAKLRRGLRNLLTPSRLVRRYPLGGCVTVGVLAFGATATAVNGRTRRHAVELFSGSLRTLREAAVGSLLTRWVWRAIDPPAPPAPSTESVDSIPRS